MAPEVYHPLTQSLNHTLTHTLIHSLTNSLTHSQGVITSFVPIDVAIRQYEEEREQLNNYNNVYDEADNLRGARKNQIDLSLECARALRQSGLNYNKLYSIIHSLPLLH